MMKFRTVQGSADCFKREFERVDVLLAALTEVIHVGRSVSLPIAQEIVESLTTIHNVLQRMTGEGEQITMVGRENPMAGELLKNQWFAAELAFARGAVQDPFLYSDDAAMGVTGFQQGAVLNLRKAQWLLAERLNILVPKSEAA